MAKTKKKSAAEKSAAEKTLDIETAKVAAKIKSNNELPIDDSFDKVAGVDPSLQFSPIGIENQNQESRLLDVLKGIMSTDNMEVRSVLETKHEIALIRIIMFAEKYDSHMANFLYEKLLQLRVSHGGLGRKNMVAALKAVRSDDDPNSAAVESEKRRRFFR